MKRVIVLILVCLFAVPVFSQKTLGEESNGLHAVFAAAPVAFPFDGSESDIISLKPLVGAGYTLSVLGLSVTPALFLSGDLKVKNDKKENWNLNVILGIVGWKGGVLGVGYNFAKEGRGVVGLKKETLSFVFGFNFKTI